MATRKRGEGIKSVIQKLEDSINAGDYYHAEQMYKTLYYRYLFDKLLKIILHKYVYHED